MQTEQLLSRAGLTPRELPLDMIGPAYIQNASLSTAKGKMIIDTISGDITKGARDYSAAASTSCIQSSLSNRASVVQAAGDMPEFSISGVAGPKDGQVTLSWSDSAIPAHDGYYIVYTDKDNTDGGGCYDFPGYVKTATIPGLTNGQTYDFIVYAYSGLEFVASSQPVSATPQAGPVAPTGLFLDLGPGSGEVTLKWSPSSGPNLAGYHVHWGTGSDNYTQSFATTDTSWTVLLLYDLHYYFKVAAYNTDNIESSDTSPVSVTLQAPDLGVFFIPDPPSSLISGQDTTISVPIYNIGTADAGPFSVALFADEETKPRDIQEVNGVQQGDAPYVDFTITGGLDAGSHTISFVTDYYEEVEESNENNNIAITDPWEWGEPDDVPDLEVYYIYDPTSLIEGENTTISALIVNGGSAGAGPFSVALFKDADKDPTQVIKRNGLPEEEFDQVDFTIGGLNAGSHTIIIVVDYNGAELSKTNNSGSGIWPWEKPPTPNQPTGVTADPGPGSGEVTITWDSSNDPEQVIDYYNIYVRNLLGYQATYNGVPIDWNAGKTVISDLTNGTIYYFAVTAVNSYGVESVPSGEASATPSAGSDDIDPPTAPFNLSITDPGTGTDLTVSWNASTDIDVAYYLVYRLTNSSAVSGTAYDYGFPAVSGATTFHDDTVSSQNNYCYAYGVQAVDDAGNVSGIPKTACVNPVDSLAPSFPTGVGAYGGATVVDIWWDPPTTNIGGSPLTDLAGYNVYRNGIKQNSNLITNIYFEDAPMTQGTSYNYKVTAVDFIGNEGPASTTVSVTPGQESQAPKPPTLSITAKDNELDLYWTPNYEADFAVYKLYRKTTTSTPDCDNVSGYTLIASPTDDWYIDTTLTAGQIYCYKVKASDGVQLSAFSNFVSGQIGQTDIQIVRPTQGKPFTIDFNEVTVPQTVPLRTAGLTTSTGGRVQIDYKYSWVQAPIGLYIINSSGAVVYEYYDYNPVKGESVNEANFLWNGKYSDRDECVPDGLYDVYLFENDAMQAGAAVGYAAAQAEASTEERMSIKIEGCNSVYVTLVNANGSSITAEQIGEDENFVSWKTLLIRYKLQSAGIVDSAYDWEIVAGTPSVVGHDYLGTPTPSNIRIDKTSKTISFVPGSTGRQQMASSLRAKPLAFELRFKLNNQVVRTFQIQQSHKNTIREEYNVYKTSNITTEQLPKYSDFDGKLKPENLVYCSYSAIDVPKGEKLNNLVALLPANQYTFTSTYRNPYRNQYAGSTSVKSRHAWAGAMDLKDQNSAGKTDALKTLWSGIKDKAEYGLVLVESAPGDIIPVIKKYLVSLNKNVVDGSIKITAMQKTFTSAYAIVWQKQAGWQWVKYNWKEQLANTTVAHTGEQYTLQEADWNDIARNLHVQDKTSSQWGF